MLFTACQPGNQQETASPAPQSIEESVNTGSNDQTSPQDAQELNTVETSSSTSPHIETSYVSPAGEEKVSFTLTVDGQGTITDAQTGVLAKSPISKMRQNSFAKDLPSALVGKKLADLSSIDRVGGSSLTTGAFNKALAELKAQQ